MKRGKYEKIPVPRKRRAKPMLLLICLVLILGLSIGGTLAYIAAKSGTVNNEFSSAQVSCEAVSDGGAFSVKNTSNIPAYIRASYAVNWMDASGNVSGTTPVAGTDYELSVDSGWTESGGIYYYQDSVAVDAAPAFITVTGIVTENGDYKLTVEVIAEAIQADGMGEDVDTAQEAWAAALSRPGNG